MIGGLIYIVEMLTQRYEIVALISKGTLFSIVYMAIALEECEDYS